MVQLNKPHIGIFGRMNVGKSSLVNALTGQEVSVVADTPGTTTDPVKKTVEIVGLGPVVLVDTAGTDDTSALGAQRVGRTRAVLEQIDLAMIAFSGAWGTHEAQLAAELQARGVPFFAVHTKSDLSAWTGSVAQVDVVDFSCKKPDVVRIIAAIKAHLPKGSYAPDGIIDGYIKRGEEVVLVIPVDGSAPAGRLILPQVQTIRNLLDIGAIAVCVKDTQLADYLATHTPKLVITDSQVFAQVNRVVPPDIPLTSFSILFSRLKGDFEAFLAGTRTIASLQDGDKILVLESCSHSVNKCDDIGRTKIPAWLQQKTGKRLQFTTVANLDALPADLPAYKLAIQCGGCMVTRTQILQRLDKLQAAGVPVSNYGLTIAYCHGIFDRATELFK